MVAILGFVECPKSIVSDVLVVWFGFGLIHYSAFSAAKAM